MGTNDQYSVERIADRMAIQDAIYRWCRGVDRLDYDAVRSAFHPDAIDNHGAYVGNIDGLIEWMRERHKKIPFSMHRVTNILIEFAGRDLALVESYLRTIQRYPPDAKASLAQIAGGKQGNSVDGADLYSCSRYVDRFERRNGEWRIVHRTLVQDWLRIVDVPASELEMPKVRTPGRRDKADLLYAERETLGLTAYY